MTWIRNGVMALVATLLFFGLTEVALRLFVARDLLLFSWERPGGSLQISSDNKGLINRAGHHAEVFDGGYRWEFSIDKNTFRESVDIPPKKPEGQWRLLALGDSWIFGYSADQGHTMPDYLEKILARETGRSVEIINGGVPGSCALDMLLRYCQLSQEFEFDGVILGQPHNSYRQVALAGWRGEWYNMIHVSPAMKSYIYLGLRRLLAPYYLRPRPELQGETELESSVRDLETLTRMARERDLPVWMALEPVAFNQEIQAPTPNPNELYVYTLGRLGVKFGWHALRTRDCWGRVDTAHPGPSGYHTIARVMADVILGKVTEVIERDDPLCSEM